MPRKKGSKTAAKKTVKAKATKGKKMAAKAGSKGRKMASTGVISKKKGLKRYTDAQKKAILREAASVGSAAAVIRKHGIANATFYAWKQRLG